MESFIEYILFDMNFIFLANTFSTILIALAIYYFKFAWVSGSLKKEQLTKLGLGIGVLFVSIVSEHYYYREIYYIFFPSPSVSRIIGVIFLVGLLVGFFIFLGAAFDANEKEEQNVDEINKEK